MSVALLPLVVRIDARRPASWLALGMAATAVTTLASACVPAAAAGAVAFACGGWAAAAAVGHPPGGAVPGGPGIEVLWRWSRAAWPMSGALAAAVALRLAGGDGLPVALGLAVGAGVATALAAAATARGAVAADATSLGLIGSSVAASAGATGGGGGWAAVGLATVAAVAVTVAAWTGWRLGRDLAWRSDAETASARASFAAIGFDRPPLRRAVCGLGMIASLAGMAGWYFLAPLNAPVGLPAAVGWFTALAVPAVVLGAPADEGWEALAASGATVSPWWPRWRRPGWLRWAAATSGGHAAVFGWPPLLAGLIQGEAGAFGGEAAGCWPWITLAAVVLAAVALVGLVLVSSRAKVSRDTVLALAAGLVVAAGVLAAMLFPGFCHLPRGPK